MLHSEDENKNVTENAQPEGNAGSPESPEKQRFTGFFIFVGIVAAALIGCLIYGVITKNVGGVMAAFGSVCLAIVVLLVMITVHEFGHYVAGKSLGFGITEFAIGFGPAIYKKKRKNGEYFSVRALPIGGFCAFEGEDDDSQSPTAFNNRKPWQRIIVLVAGAAMNFILALVLIVMLFGIYGQSMYTAFEVMPNTSYEYLDSSLVSGDIVVSLEGKTIYLTTDLLDALEGKSRGDEVSATIIRDGKQMDVKLILRADVVAENSTDLSGVSRALGIARLIAIDKVEVGSPFLAGDAIFRERSGDYGAYGENGELNPAYLAENRIYSEEDLYHYLKPSEGGEAKLWIFRDGDYYKLTLSVPELGGEYVAGETYKALGINTVTYEDRWSTEDVRLGFFRTLGGTFVYAFRIAGTIFRVLGELITGALGLNAVGGTVTTIVMTSQVIRLGGFKFLLQIAAYIGVNLAVFNMLPIPALDGSRVVFTLIEWIFRKPVPKKIEGVIHTVGLLLLLGFAVMVDLMQLF